MIICSRLCCLRFLGFIWVNKMGPRSIFKLKCISWIAERCVPCCTCHCLNWESTTLQLFNKDVVQSLKAIHLFESFILFNQQRSLLTRCKCLKEIRQAFINYFEYRINTPSHFFLCFLRQYPGYNIFTYAKHSYEKQW